MRTFYISDPIKYLLEQSGLTSAKELRYHLKEILKSNKNDRRTNRYIKFLIKECKFYNDYQKSTKKV